MSLRDVLVVYDRLGYCVIPVRPHDKAPAVDGGWAAYQQRRSTPAEWEHWWPGGELGEMNIGVVTGSVSNLVVLDCDDDDTYRDLTTACPALLNTQTVRTGKGWHIYVRPDRPTKSTSFRLHGKVHHVSSDGRQVVAPPSIHPSGRRYQFANSLDPIDSIDMEDLGRAILEIGGEPAAPPVKERPSDWASDFYRDGQRFSIGERNERLTQLAGVLRYYLPDHQWALARGILRDWNRMYCHPPLTDAEVDATVNSVSRYRPHRGEQLT